MNKHSIKLLFFTVLTSVVLSCIQRFRTEKSPGEDHSNRPLSKWPWPQPHEIEVMVLGMYHMSNPHQDGNNINADDVRSGKRQKELRELAQKLAAFNPDLIAAEVRYTQQDLLDSLYQDVPIDTLLAKYTNEAIQVACRLGHMLDLPRIHAIDFPMRLGNDSLSALWKKYDGQIPHKLDYPVLDWDTWNTQQDSLLQVSTITEFLIEKNREESHLRNHYTMFADLRSGELDNFGGAINLARWYERNFKMVHNIYRAATPETQRILLIIGSGHVSPIRHILDDAPMFCPVSPMPYLTKQLL